MFTSITFPNIARLYETMEACLPGMVATLDERKFDICTIPISLYFWYVAPDTLC